MIKSNIFFPFALLLLFLGLTTTNAQDLKSLKKQIKEQQTELRVNEEMLFSGTESLKKTKTKLDKAKLNNALSPEDISRKENIVSKIENRLSKLDNEIKRQRKTLSNLKTKYETVKKGPQDKAKSYKKTEVVSTPKKGVNKENVEKNKKAETDINVKEKELSERNKKLKIAREKIDAEKKQREEELLKLENERLAKVNNAKKEKELKKIQAEEIENNKVLTEKKKRIIELEDDISFNQEILTSGLEGLAKSKERLQRAKVEGASKEDIARKETIVKRLASRLNDLQAEIQEKKTMISKIKAE